MSKPNIIQLQIFERASGAKESQKLRSEKLVPAVLYGPAQKENFHFSIKELDLEKILRVKLVQFIELNFKDGKKVTAFLKTTQFHPVTDRPLHVDFYVLDDKTPVTLTVPIRLTGSSPGVLEGGRLYQSLRKLSIKCLPTDVVSEILLDISDLKIGSTLKVKNLALGGLTPLMSPERTIVVIRPPKGGLQAEEEAEAAAAAAAAEASGSEEGSASEDSE